MDFTDAQKAAIETCREFEIAYRYLKYLPLEELVTITTIVPMFLENAKKLAMRDYKNLSIVPEFFGWLGGRLEPFCQLFKGDVLKTLTLEYCAAHQIPNYAEAAGRIIRDSTELTTLRLICLPNQTVDITFELPPSVSTVSFITLDSFHHVYGKLHHFRNLQNLNFFQDDVGNGDTNMHLLTQWLQTYAVANSIWLPDRCNFNLELISQVLTIRIHVIHGKENFSNLHSLENLTKLRIEAYADQSSTALTLQLLREYGSSNGQKLIELHLSCDFNTRPLPEILLMFTNLQKLIIVHNELMEVSLEENLQWPQNLADLKCCTFEISKATFEELVGREHLRRLDIFFSVFTNDVLDKGLEFNRTNDYKNLEILMTMGHCRRMTFEEIEKYLCYGNVKLLNDRHKEFVYGENLGINIEFVGLEELCYWAHLK